MKTFSGFFKYFTASFVLITALSALFPVPANSASVEDAVHSALENHPTVEAAHAFLVATEKDVQAQRSGYYPRLSINAQGGRMFGDNATTRGLSVTRGSGYSYLWEGSASLSQPIFDGFETSSKVSAAMARTRSADMDLLDARESLALRAAQSYINVMRAHTGMVMLKKHSYKVNDYLQRIKAAVDEGAADESEYQQALDVKLILESFVSDYEGQARTAEAQYREAVGALPDGDLAVPEPDASFILNDVEEAIRVAKQSHPSVKSAIFSARAAEHSIETEKAALYPGFDGELSYLKSDKRELLGGEVEDARAILRMNWNFETGGGQLSRIDKRKYELSEARAREREVARQLESTIRQSYTELDTAKKQLEHLEERLGLNQKLFDTYETQFEGARISLLQLMQADNQVFNVMLEKMNAEYRIISAQYGVLASLGKLQSSVELAMAE